MAQDSQQTIVTSDTVIKTPGQGLATSRLATLYIFNTDGVLTLKIKGPDGIAKTLRDGTNAVCKFIL